MNSVIRKDRAQKRLQEDETAVAMFYRSMRKDRSYLPHWSHMSNEDRLIVATLQVIQEFEHDNLAGTIYRRHPKGKP